MEVHSQESRLVFPKIERLEAFPRFVQNKGENSVMRATEQSAVLRQSPEFSQHC